MKILAIDSSGLVASVAVTEDDVLISEYTTNYKKTHSQTLLPMLDEVKKMTELDLSTLDAIAVSAGPGSFTGLRIGSATAKGLGLALDKPLIGVPTVDALAMNLYGTDSLICPLMDARRNQVYTGVYTFEPVSTEDRMEAGKVGADSAEAELAGRMDGHEQSFRLKILEPQCVLPIEEIVGKVHELAQGRPAVFLGDGVPVFREKIRSLMKIPFSFAPAPFNRQRAASVALLAAQYAAEGRMEHARDHVPEYLRQSQAERERKEVQEKYGEAAGNERMKRGLTRADS